MEVPTVRIVIKFMTQLLSVQFYFVAIYIVNALLRPWEAYLFQTHLRGGDLIETGREGGLIETGGLFNLAKMMVSVLHKEL